MSRYIVYEEEESVMYVESESKCNFRRNGSCYCNRNMLKFGKKCAGEDNACFFYEKERMKRGQIKRSRIDTREGRKMKDGE